MLAKEHPNPDEWATELLAWYDKNGRKGLPWKTSDQRLAPYYALVSEYMLQQTQAQRVAQYFLRFIATFPTLSALAQAELSQVLVHWSGLGYYRRAGYLHQSARMLWQDMQQGKEFPRNATALMRLPGVGKSTANAILAQAFDRPEPILDANARRVLLRLYGLHRATDELLWEKAQLVTNTKPACARAADYCQAIMDFGSMLCRKSPLCNKCFAASSLCVAHIKGEQNLLTNLKKPVAKKRVRIRAAMVFSDQGLWLRPQHKGDLWPYTLFPLAASDIKTLKLQFESAFANNQFRYLGRRRTTALLTHRRVEVQALFFYCSSLTVAEQPPGFGGLAERGWYNFSDTALLPLSSLAMKLANWTQTLVHKQQFA